MSEKSLVLEHIFDTDSRQCFLFKVRNFGGRLVL